MQRVPGLDVLALVLDGADHDASALGRHAGMDPVADERGAGRDDGLDDAHAAAQPQRVVLAEGVVLGEQRRLGAEVTQRASRRPMRDQARASSTTMIIVIRTSGTPAIANASSPKGPTPAASA